MASSPFERQVVEADNTEDTATTTPSGSDGPQQYPPAPSFLEHDRPTIRLAELPAWLQSFAASVGEPPDSEAPPPKLGSTEQPPAPEPEATEPDSEPEGLSTRQEPEYESSESFISEDDLPEWLRSIAPEDPGETVADSLVIGPASEREQFAVPNVTRAWSTSKDSRGIDEATSLFALVASQTPQNSLPNQAATAASQGGAPQRGSATGLAGGYGSNHPPGAQSQTDDLQEGTDTEANSESPKSSLPILPILVAGILLVLLVGAAVALFLL